MDVSESLTTTAIKSNAVVADAVHFTSRVELVKCESCGFTEECTLPYISQIKEHYNGRWICGLCMEAVKCEILRSGNLKTTEEALVRHIDFYNSFRSSCRLPFSDADHPISVMGRILRRRLNSQRQNGVAGLGIKKHFLVEGALKEKVTTD